MKRFITSFFDGSQIGYIRTLSFQPNYYMSNNIVKLRCFALALLVCTNALGQDKSNIQVSPYTGNANVTIPIYTVNAGSLSVPVFLSYQTTGVKVSDLPGYVGMTWQLNAGGQITRTLRGLPDDCQTDLSGSARFGWLYNSDGTKINNFTIANQNVKNCTQETADITYINSNFGDFSDTEPDVFNIDAPGLSCQFVFDRNHNVQVIPYKDLKITYTVDGSGLINTFTVINGQGMKYVFQATVSASRKAATTYAVNYFKTAYNQYKNGINYTKAWSLVTLQDAKGNLITFSYSPVGPNLISTTPVALDIGLGSGSTTRAYQYTLTESVTDQSVISTIASNFVVSFFYSLASDGVHYNLTNFQGNGRDILFNYTMLSGASGVVFRDFLTSIAERTCNYPMGYQFAYYGNQTAILPDTSSKQVDYWGYYANNQTNATLLPAVNVNPSNTAFPVYQNTASTTVGSDYNIALSGANRSADPSNVMAGSLSTITYAGGGTATLAYESNDYLDPTSNTVVKGGGIRVKQITEYDGINAANNMVRNYTYTDPANGNLSSGKPLSLPQYAFTIPYTGTGTPAVLWNYSTARSETDLSGEDEAIVYSTVKVSQTGAGSNVFQYFSPVNYWTMSASPDWNATIDNIARTNCANSDLTTNHSYSYPFAPNINYDFERGLASKVSQYNDAGQEVQETDYSYARTGSPIVITALKTDNDLTSLSYAKYNIYTTCDELVSTETKKIFDSQTFTLSQTSGVNYYYTSANHKLVTKITSTGSDGSISSQTYSYIKDYAIPTTTDANLLAMQKLQQNNVNELVEKITSVQRSGSTQTISAQLTKFKTFGTTVGITLHLPSQQLQFVAPDGVSNFSPMTTGTGVTVADSRYQTTENDVSYDFSGNVVTSNDNYHHVKTVLTNEYFYKPTLIADHADSAEFAYQDFDNDAPGNLFAKSGTSTMTSASRTGANALALEAGGTLSASIKRNQQAKNYVFSCWVNSSAAVSLSIQITSNGTTTPYTLNIANPSGKWKYAELKIPTSALASTFTVSLSSTSAISIDDILLYPDIASVTTYAYNIYSGFKTAETNTNGVSNYFSYDQYGRLLYQFDQDMNIVFSKNYLRKSDQTPSYIISPSFQVSGGSYSVDPFIFTNTTVTNGCLIIDNVTYSWNFGDGTTATGMNATHTFAAAGSYNVVLTATSPVYGQFTYTYPVVVTPNPGTLVTVEYENASIGVGGAITSMKFLKGSSVIYSFTTANLTAGVKVVPDQYTIVVTTSGTTSNYKSLTYSGKITKCSANIANPGLYNYTDDIRSKTSIYFDLDIATCAP